MDQFKNKTVVVTGGSRGIGKAIVTAFAAEGAKVFFTYLNHEPEASATAAQTGSVAVKCNQTSEQEISATVDDIVQRCGTVDILVNNAGVVSDQFIMLMPQDDWMKVIDTNINGAFRWTKAVSRPMINSRSGAIVNIASVSGLVGIGGQTNYAASKGALIAFSRSCAAELGPKGIRVNTVVPGFIDTDMTSRMSRTIKHQNLERILLHRFGTGAEVADAVTFLASEKASYIIGQTIVVDGGLCGTVT